MNYFLFRGVPTRHLAVERELSNVSTWYTDVTGQQIVKTARTKTLTSQDVPKLLAKAAGEEV